MKKIFLYTVKLLGGFWLARFILRDKTLILAYHGFEVIDESDFRPQLFIKKSTFEKRLRYINKHCNVIKLDELFKNKDLNNSVVITIDDGWASTLSVAAPLLNRFEFPYTIYLTTESVLVEQPIFHILLDYILRRSLGKSLFISNEVGCIESTIVSLENLSQLTSKIDKLKAKKSDTELLRKIAINLEFDLDEVLFKKAFHLLSADEVREVVNLNADIQLHTHTHHTYLDNEKAFIGEIVVNQSHISDITGTKATHHCYPSGSYNEECFKALQTLNIKSATTCVPGFCDDTTNTLELPRFLDGENIPQIVFEAEVSGVLELLRACKRKLFSR